MRNGSQWSRILRRRGRKGALWGSCEEESLNSEGAMVYQLCVRELFALKELLSVGISHQEVFLIEMTDFLFLQKEFGLH